MAGDADPPRRATSRARSRRRRCGARDGARSPRATARREPSGCAQQRPHAGERDQRANQAADRGADHPCRCLEGEQYPSYAARQREPATSPAIVSRRSAAQRTCPWRASRPGSGAPLRRRRTPPAMIAAGRRTGPEVPPARGRRQPLRAPPGPGRVRPKAGPAPRRASRNPRWIIFCTAAYAEREFHPDRSALFPRKIADVTRTYREAAV